MGIIYEIRNLANDKPYVGSSERGFKERCLWEHRAELRKNEHSHNSHLQRAWNKYGEDKFEFNILIEIQNDYIIKAEQYWIDKLNAYEKGYNGEKYANSHRRIRMNGENNPMWKGGQVELSCKNCTNTYTVNRSKSENSKFCSMGCMLEYRVGEKHPKYKEKIKKECNFCSKNYKVKPSIKDETKYCSMSCKSQDQNKGKNNGRWNGGKVEIECKRCDDNFKVTPSIKNERKFCSQSCKSKFQNSGENNGKSILNKDQVKQIKKLLKDSDLYMREIADKFNVSLSCISGIKYGHNWSQVEV